MPVPHHRQEKFNTCGAACMRMVLEHFGIKRSEKQLAKELKTTIFYGTLHKDLVKTAWKYDLQHYSITNATIKDLKDFLAKGYAIILSYRPPDDFYHYSVVKSIDDKQIILNDPWYGPLTKYDHKDFLARWKSNPLFERKRRWLLAVKK